MKILPESVGLCSTCGRPLNVNSECLPCLVRIAFDEPAEAATAPPASLVFGDFEVEQRPDGFYWELGHGAMGVTYLAMDKVLHRRVALKVIEVPATARSSQAMRERFLREARAAAALRHPNVAGVFQFGASPDASHCYYAMEVVEGETLEARVRRDGPLNAKSALEIAIQITRALMAAAAHGLIHRDLKPGNIMLTRGDTDAAEPEVKVIDFGLAKAIADAGGETDLTHGEFVGTPNFASPEQFGSGPVDARSDIYSLGATLWFALSGLAPHSGSTIEEIRDRQTRDDLPVEQLVARKVPEPIIKLLRCTLAVDPARRPASARELMEALESCRRKLSHGIGVYKIAALIAVVAIVAAALFVIRLNRREITSASARNVAPSASALTPLPEKSIAVLPLENLSHDPDNVSFAEGMQDEILARLSKIADLKVISRTSTQKYKSAPDNLREIAKQLGVGNVLEGSVQKSGDAVRVNVQLINALNDTHLWGDVYERKLTDIFAVESDIAKTIADTLQAKLTGAEKQLIAAQPTTDLTAYELYLKGRSLWSKRGGENLRQAIGFYEQAIARDPKYALAYAGLADAYVLLPFYTATAPQDAYHTAKAAALKALQLDEKLAEAHTALGLLLCIGDLDMAGSISEFQRAIALNPNYATAHHWYGNSPFLALGRFEEAITEGKRAVELDPLSPIINADLGQNLYNARRYDEAIAQLRKTLEIDPTFYYTHFNLGIALQLKGDMPAAIAEYTQAQQLSDDQFIPVLLASAKAQSGDKDAAIQMLAELEELSQHRYVSSYWRTLLYLSLGNRDEAVRWLEQAAHDGLSMTTIKVDPLLDPLRGDPRFEALVQKVIGVEHKQRVGIRKDSSLEISKVIVRPP
jgi:serine/threonine protein kinase/tetratricopeptide (TPR) repeat protein